MQKPQVRPADPCVMVIFGGAGDLTRRKLVPSLYNLARQGLLNRSFAVVGLARTPMTEEEFRRHCRQALGEFDPGCDPAAAGWLDSLRYVAASFDDPQGYVRLSQVLAEVDPAAGTGGNFLFYLATPPQFFGVIATHLGQAGLARPPEGSWRRIVVEKPFGRDLASALALNRTLLASFREEQLFRIDHYLGKETLRNVLLFRFANGIFEPIWDRRYIDQVQLLVGETLGVEGRGSYYETAGALRDIIENHLFQVMTLVAMEPPNSLEAEPLRNEKVKVLQAIRPLSPEDIRDYTVRGQYGPGSIDGQPVPGYRQEPGVSPRSNTETYAALRIFLDNWRWAGVPFYLRTGKRLKKRDTRITLQFKRAPLPLLQGIDANLLTIHIQPDERITLYFQAKRPGPRVSLAPVELQFAYNDLEGETVGTGYETLLYDVMVGDASLFHRADMVEAAWRVVTPVLESWAATPEVFPNYEAGSWGPALSDQMLARDGRHWLNPR
ncbi:MAG TPA: glucose-6-phosphate dehydrogenase [Candidatus Nitrosotenuis sp.]|nr:glucose-6-phosphate dehydrogenase [Candidatus Nitrosotenuis sp.]